MGHNKSQTESFTLTRKTKVITKKNAAIPIQDLKISPMNQHPPGGNTILMCNDSPFTKRTFMKKIPNKCVNKKITDLNNTSLVRAV